MISIKENETTEYSLKGHFRPANNVLEGEEKTQIKREEDAFHTCSKCANVMRESEFKRNALVCPRCGCHHKMPARDRVALISDYDSFSEMNADIVTDNPLEFPDYEKKIAAAEAKSGEKESVITGTARICGIPCCLFVMVSEFMMGSMGAATGEKLVRLFEYAAENKLPVIGYAVSGGARMQEGMYSLMQMAKVSAAVRKHSDAGQLYICVLTDPTTGGVTASFAMQGDLNIAEPGALIGFAGPRVIRQTMQTELPEGFQTAEYVLQCGFLDAVVPRNGQRSYLAKMLRLHGYKQEEVQNGGI